MTELSIIKVSLLFDEKDVFEIVISADDDDGVIKAVEFVKLMLML